MNYTIKNLLRVGVALGCVLSLTAQADTASPSNTKPMAKSNTHWVQAASKHNGSGIRLRYSVPATAQPGQAATVQLQFSGVVADDASVELRAPEGATLVGVDGAPLSRVELPRGQLTSLVLHVTPSVEGEQSIDVFTTQAERSSAQSVPLKVGKGGRVLKASGTPQTTPTGEKVISLPAQSK